MNTNTESRRDAGITDLFGSMLGLATAGTRFTIQQMQNAMSMFTDSQGVMNRVRDSMDNISCAMTQPASDTSKKYAASEPQPAEEFSGRKV